MSEYDMNGDGYTDQAITAEFTDGSSATVVDVDGDGYADVVTYEPADHGYDDPGYEEPGNEEPGNEEPGYDDGGPVPTDVESSSSYYNEYTDTGVSSDGDVGYISLGDGTFQDFGMD